MPSLPPFLEIEVRCFLSGAIEASIANSCTALPHIRGPGIRRAALTVLPRAGRLQARSRDNRLVGVDRLRRLRLGHPLELGHQRAPEMPAFARTDGANPCILLLPPAANFGPGALSFMVVSVVSPASAGSAACGGIIGLSPPLAKVA